MIRKQQVVISERTEITACLYLNKQFQFLRTKQFNENQNIKKKLKKKFKKNKQKTKIPKTPTKLNKYFLI